MPENRMNAAVQQDHQKGEQRALFEPQLVQRASGTKEKASFNDPAFGTNKSLPVHRWVPWIAGFSCDFVQDILRNHLHKQGTVLDPFAGVGTTLVEATRLDHHAIGFEINPYAALACRVKLNAFHINASALRAEINKLTAFYLQKIASNDQPVTAPPPGFKTRVDFYSPQVLRKVLIIQDFAEGLGDEGLQEVFRLAFAATMVQYSNYSYEPSLGTRSGAGKTTLKTFLCLKPSLESCRRLLKML